MHRDIEQMRKYMRPSAYSMADDLFRKSKAYDEQWIGLFTESGGWHPTEKENALEFNLSEEVDVVAFHKGEGLTCLTFFVSGEATPRTTQDFYSPGAALEYFQDFLDSYTELSNRRVSVPESAGLFDRLRGWWKEAIG